MAKPIDRKLTFTGLEKSYVAGAICTHIAEMTRQPWAFPVRDVERSIRILDETRAAIGTENVNVETNSRMNRIVDAAERAIAAGKFMADQA